MIIVATASFVPVFSQQRLRSCERTKLKKKKKTERGSRGVITGALGGEITWRQERLHCCSYWTGNVTKCTPESPPSTSSSCPRAASHRGLEARSAGRSGGGQAWPSEERERWVIPKSSCCKRKGHRPSRRRSALGPNGSRAIQHRIKHGSPNAREGKRRRTHASASEQESAWSASALALLKRLVPAWRGISSSSGSLAEIPNSSGSPGNRRALYLGPALCTDSAEEDRLTQRQTDVLG